MTITRFSTGAIRDNALATNTSFAASDMELIGTIRLNSNTASVTFSGIPQEYKHLQLRCIARGNYSGGNFNDNFLVRFNGDTGTNYTRHAIAVNGGSLSSWGVANTSYAYIGAIPNTNTTLSSVFGGSIVDILDYSNGSKNKTVRTLNGFDTNGQANERLCLESGVWRSTAAVTSILLTTDNGASMIANSKFALYGIRG